MRARQQKQEAGGDGSRCTRRADGGVWSWHVIRRISAAEAMRHPFFDEHFPEMGPRTPEAEKPAGFRE